MQVTGSMYFGNIFFLELCVYQRYVQKLKRNKNKLGGIKVDNFRESVNF